MMRWWWFGPAVTKSEIERELRLMKEAGIGGVEVQAVYPLALDDTASGVRNLTFLSNEFIDALSFASVKARELGLRFDLTLGSGWPYGGPTVAIGEAAGRLRVERVKVAGTVNRVTVPNLSAGERLLAVFLLAPPADGAAISAREITEIKDGAVQLREKDNGPFEVEFFIASRTGMQVKRPAVGAEGFVLDHLDRIAVDHYLKQVGDRLLQAFGDQVPYAVFCDSLEVYNADWTGDFLEEFRRRRGYDLKPHLPALIADNGKRTLAIRRDWGKTITELLNEHFLAPLHEWSQRNRTRLRIQDYGPPGAALSSNAYADLSEGEGPQWKSLSATRWASSASHLYGRSVTSSETWTWLHSPVFRATPLDMKAEADRHFLQGVNQLIGHGWPYTAEGVPYPGWRFYAAGVFNEKNPWWIVMPEVSLYLQRLSALLRQGQPANDVAVYLPNDDAWAHFKPGSTSLIETLRERLGPNLIPQLVEAGYNFDFFDDDTFKQLGRVEKGVLALGENRYRVVILPAVTSIPVDTLAKLEEFTRGGGTLIATRQTPSESPGFLATQADHQKVASLARRLFEGAAAPGRFVPDEVTGLARALTKALDPDVALSPAVPEVGFIHRRTAEAEVYFLANTGNVTHRTTATFRTSGGPGLKADWWDPMSGARQPAAIAASRTGAPSVALDLAPYESRVLVFSHDTRPVESTPAALSKLAVAPLDLSEGWRVRFDGSEPTQLDRLRSWSDDERTRYYSGTATYDKTVSITADLLHTGASIKLDFGEGQPEPADQAGARVNGMRALLAAPVRDAAVVWVNGRHAGSIWCPPYSLDVTTFMKSGENEIRVVVGNTAVNYMAGRARPDYRLLNLRYGERFQAQDMDKIQPLPSGLLGPIRLVWVVK